MNRRSLVLLVLLIGIGTLKLLDTPGNDTPALIEPRVHVRATAAQSPTTSSPAPETAPVRLATATSLPLEISIDPFQRPAPPPPPEVPSPPAPPPVKVVPVVVAAPVPAAPAPIQQEPAPAIAVLGFWVDEGQLSVFLSNAGRTVAAKSGDKVFDNYRVALAPPSQVALVRVSDGRRFQVPTPALPANVTAMISSAAEESARSRTTNKSSTP